MSEVPLYIDPEKGGRGRVRRVRLISLTEILYEKKIKSKLSGNEVFFTNSLTLLA